MTKIIIALKNFMNKGQTRTVLAKKNVLYSMIIKFFNIFIVMATVSISIKLLGVTNYGIWVVISGIITWSNLFNFGFSNGLRNKLSEALAKGDETSGQYYISTTYLFIFFISIVIFILFLIISYSIDWPSLLSIQHLSNDHLIGLLLIIFSFFILQFILGPIISILQAYQWPSLPEFFRLIGAAIILLILAINEFMHEGMNLNDYVLYVSAVPALILFIATVYLFLGQYKKIRPSIKKIDLSHLSSLSKMGIAFFAIQVNAIIILQTDNIIISHIFGPEKVTEYNIVQRYFGLITVFFLAAISPYWSAVTDAYVQGDFSWINKTTKKLMVIIGVSAAASLFMYLISDWFYRIWIGDNIAIDPILSAMMGIYVVLFSFALMMSHFSNGTGKLRIQLISQSLAALFNIPLSFLFAHTFLGVSGVLLATICSLTFTTIVLYIQYIKIINHTASGIWNK